MRLEPSGLRRSCELRHDLREPLAERRLGEHLVEARGMRRA
jgi:hypothetical protein